MNVIGGGVRRRQGQAKTAELPAVFEALPEPTLPDAETAYSIMVAGIGGTGVVTIGALLGMAANLEGRNATVLDATGLAQKGGPVVSHVRIADKRENLHAVRVPAGGAKVLIACDIVTATQPDVLAKMSRDQSFAIVNTQETMNGYFAGNADLRFPGDKMRDAIRAAAGDNSSHFVAATKIATKLLGDSIAANGFMPSAARPAANVTACCSAMPTSKWRSGNFLAKMSVDVPDGMAAVIAQILSSVSPSFAKVWPNTFW